jgi:hypothetical protein
VAGPNARSTLTRLLDAIPERDLPTVQAFLEFLVDRAARTGGQPEDDLPPGLRDAPLDEEPVTHEDEVAIAEAYAALNRGEVLTEAEIRRELGLPH